MNKQKSQGEYLYNFLYTLFKRKFLIVATFITTFTGIIFGTYLVLPLWKATAKVRVQYSPKQQLTMFEDITTPGITVPGVNPANDVVQMLTSRELAEKVVTLFWLDKLLEKRDYSPESNREIIRWHINNFLIDNPKRFLQSLGILSEKPTNYFAMAVEEFQKDLEDIGLEENTTVVNVAVWGESPEISTAMTNSLIQLLLEKNLVASKTPIDETIKLTEKQMEKAEQDLRIAQERLRQFKEKSRLVLYNEEASILLQRLDKYEAELHSMVSSLESMRIEKSADHPDVKSLETRINEYRKIIIPGIRRDLASLPLKEVELTKLNQELKTRGDLYSTLKMKILELEVLKDASIGDLELKVIDHASVYSYVKPDWPRWIINMPLGFIASILVSLGFVFFLEYWNSSFNSVKDIEESIPLPVFGSVPKFGFLKKQRLIRALTIKTSKNSQRTLSFKASDQRCIELLAHYDPLANALYLSSRKLTNKLFLITSAGKSEGKSTIAAVLSKILTLRGKRVLLIEANLRTPSFEHILKIKRDRGLVDYYLGYSDLKDVIVNINGIDVIFAGDPSAHHIDPFEIFSSDRMETLLEYAKTNYDLILLDSPCIKWFKDPLILTALSESVILIVEANHTPKRVVVMATEKIKSAGGQIKGIILNKQTKYVPSILQDFISSL
jgi:tyrosine-protein kinase Etk/Wzc